MIQILASCADNVGIGPELFQARSCLLYLVTEYLVDNEKGHYSRNYSKPKQNASKD